MRIQLALTLMSVVNGSSLDPCQELDRVLDLGAGSYIKGSVCHALAWKVSRGSGPICFHSSKTRDECPGKHPVHVEEAIEELKRLGGAAETTVAPKANSVVDVAEVLKTTADPSNPESPAKGHEAGQNSASPNARAGPAWVRPAGPVMLEPFVSKSETMELLVMGDIGHSNSIFTKTVKTTAAKLGGIVSAGIVLGDNFYTHGVQSVDDPMFKSVFEDILAKLIPNIPFHMILGNHDHLGNIDAQLEYSTRNPQWVMPFFHYRRNLISGDGAVTCVWFLDTDPLAHKFSLKDPAQIAWLDATLADPACRWKIVVGHHPVYDAGEYSDNKRMIGRVLPILEKHGVHMYMSGHEHQTQVLYKPEVSPITFVISGLTSEKRGVDRQPDHPVCIWQDVKNLAVVQLSINREAITYTVHKASGEIDEAPLYSGSIH